MNNYEAKQEARRQRMLARSKAANAESGRFIKQARDKSDMIPMGQPILIGHHSEGRDRRFRAGIDRDMRKGVEADAKARHYADKAAAVGTGGVSSDDPDAVVKLKADLQKRQDAQARMKQANAVIKKNKPKGAEAQVAALVELGYDESQASKIVTPDFCGRVGFPDYALKNNNANIRRIKKRIDALSTQVASVEEQTERYAYREDADENRVMFEFDGKPVAAIRNVLKHYGFRWSPNRGAWVRQLTNNARFAARAARSEIDQLEV